MSNLNDIINQQREEIGQLREQLEKANERGEELQDALVDDAKAKAMLNKLTMENGELSIKASGNIFHVFCEAFVETFKGSGATNYLVAEFNSEELGAFTVTMQRSEGLTVYQKLNEANKRVAELEQNQLPIENGKNRYGLDVSYFRNVINRELNRSLENHKPDELARVFARLSRTADKSVMFEPEFSNKFAIEKKIEAINEALDYYEELKASEEPIGAGSILHVCLGRLVSHQEQLRKEQGSE